MFITARKRSLGQGNIFTSMCQEFCSQGVGVVCTIACWDTTPGKADPLGKETPWQGRNPPGKETTPWQGRPPHSACWEIRSTSGRYASYWNAILFSCSLGDRSFKKNRWDCATLGNQLNKQADKQTDIQTMKCHTDILAMCQKLSCRGTLDLASNRKVIRFAVGLRSVPPSFPCIY